MYYRDSSQNSMHVLNGIAAGVDSSNGVALYGTSTGGVVEPISDDANTSLIVRGKGTGAVVVGNSSSPVQWGQTFVIQFTPASLAASTSVQSTITVAGLAAGRPLVFTPTTPGLSMAYAFRAQCSTANELRFTQQNLTASTIGTGESTARGILIQL